MAGMIQRSQRFLKHSLPSLTVGTSDVNLVREGKKNLYQGLIALSRHLEQWRRQTEGKVDCFVFQEGV